MYIARSVENWPEAITYSVAILVIGAIIIAFILGSTGWSDDDE